MLDEIALLFTVFIYSWILFIIKIESGVVKTRGSVVSPSGTG